jgi:hypothetical protein
MLPSCSLMTIQSHSTPLVRCCSVEARGKKLSPPPPRFGNLHADPDKSVGASRVVRVSPSVKLFRVHHLPVSVLERVIGANSLCHSVH